MNPLTSLFQQANAASTPNPQSNPMQMIQMLGQLEQTIAAQAQRINQLELAQQMCGVVRYPMTYAYSAGASPFCGGPCAGNAI